MIGIVDTFGIGQMEKVGIFAKYVGCYVLMAIPIACLVRYIWEDYKIVQKVNVIVFLMFLPMERHLSIPGKMINNVGCVCVISGKLVESPSTKTHVDQAAKNMFGILMLGLTDC